MILRLLRLLTVQILYRLSSGNGSVGSRGNKLAHILGADVAGNEYAVSLCFAVFRRGEIPRRVGIGKSVEAVGFRDPSDRDEKAADLKLGLLAELVFDRYAGDSPSLFSTVTPVSLLS